MKQPETPLTRWLGDVPAADALVALAELHQDAAVFVVDRNRTVVHWNQGAAKLLGFAADEIVGEHCLKANRCANCVAGCGIARFKEVRNVPIDLHDAQGNVVRVRKNGRAFFDDRGEFAGGVEILVPEREVTRATHGDAELSEFHGMVTCDPAMQALFRSIRTVAKTDAATLIGGESGTGKELVARAIHNESHRASGAFVAINCAALVPSLLESELFGHVKGAFTGAAENRDGVLLSADGGTLFLDEVAELSLELQAKLLRVVERRCFVPVGGRNQICVDVRLVAATHRSLPRQVELGKFREDLMYRLRVVPLTLPPLRKRRADIHLLVWHFIRRQNGNGGRRIESVSPEAMAALEQARWSGNVRELQNAITYAFALGTGPRLLLGDLPFEHADAPPSSVGRPSRPSSTATVSPSPTVSEEERIRTTLAACQGHIGKAAAQLGMSRPTLWRKRRRYGIGDGPMT